MHIVMINIFSQNLLCIILLIENQLHGDKMSHVHVYGELYMYIKTIKAMYQSNSCLYNFLKWLFISYIYLLESNSWKNINITMFVCSLEYNAMVELLIKRALIILSFWGIHMKESQ